MPVRTAPYNTGSTIKKLMSTERDAPRTHTRARMIKLATGVALTSCITGASRASAAGSTSASTASTMLHPAPSPNPSRMRPELNPTRCQKSAWGSSCTSVRSACTGDTKNTSCPMAAAAHCHTASQNRTAPIFCNCLLLCFICAIPCCFFLCFSIPYPRPKANDRSNISHDLNEVFL